MAWTRFEKRMRLHVRGFKQSQYEVKAREFMFLLVRAGRRNGHTDRPRLSLSHHIPSDHSIRPVGTMVPFHSCRLSGRKSRWYHFRDRAARRRSWSDYGLQAFTSLRPSCSLGIALSPEIESGRLRTGAKLVVVFLCFLWRVDSAGMGLARGVKAGVSFVCPEVYAFDEKFGSRGAGTVGEKKPQCLELTSLSGARRTRENSVTDDALLIGFSASSSPGTCGRHELVGTRTRSPRVCGDAGTRGTKPYDFVKRSVGVREYEGLK